MVNIVEEFFYCTAPAVGGDCGMICPEGGGG